MPPRTDIHPVRTNLHDLDGILHLPDEAQLIWEPAHPTNFATPTSGAYAGTRRRHVAVCLHTPEELADDDEITPRLFARANFDASTGYYADSDGDLYQMVHDSDYAFAQGTPTAQLELPRPTWWLDDYISYNTCMLSMEIEGHAATIHETMTMDSPQFQTVSAWIAFVCTKYHIPITRTYVVGHGELCTWRSDPGAEFPWLSLLGNARRMARSYQESPPADERITTIETALRSADFRYTEREAERDKRIVALQRTLAGQKRADTAMKRMLQRQDKEIRELKADLAHLTAFIAEYK